MTSSTRPKNQFVISHYGPEGDCAREVHVVSKEAEAEVSALLKRLEQRRLKTEEQLITIDDALLELDVPEADRSACADEISGAVGTLAGTDDHVDFTKTPFERRFFTELCKRLPNGYRSSWLERRVISSELEDSYFSLQATAGIVHRLADSALASKGSIDRFEVGVMLRGIAYAFENADLVFARSDGPAKREATA